MRRHAPAPYQALHGHLLWWGATFFTAGAALIGAAVLNLGGPSLVVVHAGAGAALLVLAAGFAATQSWTGVSNWGVVGIGTMFAPLTHLAGRAGQGRHPWRPASRTDPEAINLKPGPGLVEESAIDLFAIVMAAASTPTGSIMLLAPSQFDAALYAQVRPHVAWYGVAFLASGVGLLVG